jgi:(1->4)-alpha-D-glucan 1-alpha-D-glucosylmutase
MVAISELPQLWRSTLQRWRVINRRWKRVLNDAVAPDANEEYLFYQTLLGTWPIAAAGQPEKTVSPEYIGRIQAYMAKALKEAKMNTSWIQPNEQWDAAMNEFVASVLDPSSKNKFLPSFLPMAEEIARLGAINSLAQVALKLTVPGVPDIYQGNEIWDFSLVDPDNRRPVDYGERRRLLEELRLGLTAEAIVARAGEGLPKLHVVHQALLARQRLGPLGEYTPLDAGPHVVGFARGAGLVTVVPRLVLRGPWREESVELPEGRWRNVLTDDLLDGGTTPVRALLARFPVALLERV